MSSVNPCVPCCTTPLSVAVPGPTGQTGITTTGASFVIPAIGSTVNITVGDSSWIKALKNLFISDGAVAGNFIVTLVNGATSITAKFLGFVGDSAAGSTIASGAVVMPGVGDLTVPWDLDALTAFTDNSGGTKADTIAVTACRAMFIVPLKLDTLTAGTYRVVVPFAFTLLSSNFRTTLIGTGASASITLTSTVSSLAVTGGVIAVTLASQNAVGNITTGSAVSGANATGAAGGAVEVVAAINTVFTAGAGYVEFTVLNLDLAATIAAIAFKLNQLRTALRHQ